MHMTSCRPAVNAVRRREHQRCCRWRLRTKFRRCPSEVVVDAVSDHPESDSAPTTTFEGSDREGPDEAASTASTDSVGAALDGPPSVQVDPVK